MPSNLYLFDPSTVSTNSSDKPLVQILREAELARSQEGARIIRNAVKRIASLFQARKPVQAELQAKKPEDVKTVAADHTRLAA